MRRSQIIMGVVIAVLLIVLLFIVVVKPAYNNFIEDKIVEAGDQLIIDLFTIAEEDGRVIMQHDNFQNKQLYCELFSVVNS